MLGALLFVAVVSTDTDGITSEQLRQDVEALQKAMGGKDMQADLENLKGMAVEHIEIPEKT